MKPGAADCAGAVCPKGDATAEAVAVAPDEDPPNGDAAAATEDPPPPNPKTLPDVELAAGGAAALGTAPKAKELAAVGLAAVEPKANALLAVVVALADAAGAALVLGAPPNENIPAAAAAGCCDPA